MKFILIPTLILSYSAEARVLFESKAEEEKKPVISIEEKIETEKPKTRASSGNLPGYALINMKPNYRIEKVSESEPEGTYMAHSLKVGSEYRVYLNSIIYGIEGSQIKISGVLLNGPAIGGSVSGYTELEPFSKKIIVKFNRLILKTGEAFELDSSLGTQTDYFIQPDKYISKKSRFLTGYVLSAFASSYLQSKVQFNQGVFFNQPNNNTRNAGYMGASRGVETISNDFESALKNSKDVAYVTSKLNYSLSILSQPKLIK